jgi:hypothetical protein
VRAGVSFSKKVVRRYEQMWKDIETDFRITDISLEKVSVDAIAEVLGKFAPILGNVTVQDRGSQVFSNSAVESDTDEEDDDYEDDDAMWADFASSFADAVGSVEEDKTENSSADITEETREQTERKKELSEIDKLINSFV